MTTETTKSRALSESRELLQRFGFNGFSFQHIADALGLTKQSLYVHFKSKEALANELLEDHRATMRRWAETIEVFEPLAKIGAWFEELHKHYANNLMLCPVTAFAGSYNSLPKSVQKNLNKTLEIRKKWLSDVIGAGQQKKEIRRDLKAEAIAETIIALAFGGQTLARITNDPEQIRRRKVDALNFIQA